MKYVDEFRNFNLAKKIAAEIKRIMPQRQIKLMEVCGTHTHSFRRFGLAKLLPKDLKLIAGPGCPVCVSPIEYIDNAIALAAKEDTTILTFGDLLRVPGTNSTLEKARAESACVHVVYSSLDALQVARGNPDKKIIFLAVGFETTAPTIALSIILAGKEKLKNLLLYTSLKIMPPVMGHLLKDKRVKLDGFLCPGHVSCIIGTKPYEFIPAKFGIPCCIAGFEPIDILQGIYLLLRQIVKKKPAVENEYSRAVTKEGNLVAKQAIGEVFKIADVNWRGLGVIKASGLKLKEEFLSFDAQNFFALKDKSAIEESQRKCRCADVLKGLILPLDCRLFSRVCSPSNPVGPCMVSREGACNAYYHYG